MVYSSFLPVYHLLHLRDTRSSLHLCKRLLVHVIILISFSFLFLFPFLVHRATPHRITGCNLTKETAITCLT